MAEGVRDRFRHAEADVVENALLDPKLRDGRRHCLARLLHDGRVSRKRVLVARALGGRTLMLGPLAHPL